MRIWIPSLVSNALIELALRRPYVHLGEYMRRYWLVKPTGHGEHSDERDMTRNQWGARVHWILKSDDDRALHDHPFDSISIVLKGGYWEHRKDGSRKWCGPGTIIRRKAEDAHRLELRVDHGWAWVEHVPCWSLFITGPWRRDWGFHTGYGWVYWRDYLDDGLLSNNYIQTNNVFLNYAGRYGTGKLYQKMRVIFPDHPEYKYLCHLSPYHKAALKHVLEVRMQVDELLADLRNSEVVP